MPTRCILGHDEGALGSTLNIIALPSSAEPKVSTNPGSELAISVPKKIKRTMDPAMKRGEGRTNKKGKGRNGAEGEGFLERRRSGS